MSRHLSLCASATVSLCLAVLAGCGEAPTILVETLQVVNMLPAHGANCVAVEPAQLDAQVTFSDDLDNDTLDGHLFVRPEGGSPLAATIRYEKSDQTAHLLLADPLEHASRYELVVEAEVVGVSQGKLPAQVVASFETISAAGCY